MILKCATNSFGRWRIFGDVRNLTYEYRSMKNYGKSMREEYSFPDSNLYIWLRTPEDCKHQGCTETAGNILVISFVADNDQKYVIMTHFQTFLMNEDGKTIETLRI